METLVTRLEEEYIRETLLSCLREFEELEEQYEWFTSPCPARIHKAVKMIDRHNPFSEEFSKAVTEAFQEGVKNRNEHN